MVVTATSLHLATMKQYKVFRQPCGNTEAVKQGWSCPASLFSFFWAPLKKLWALGVGGLVATAALAYGVALATDANVAASFMNLVLAVVSVVFGVKGNAWREANLIKRGYKPVGIVFAADAKAATENALKTAVKTAVR